MTSYNPFGFSKVASGHDLSRQVGSPETCRQIDNFCQRIGSYLPNRGNVRQSSPTSRERLSFLLLSYYTAWL
jgi:hypothetical protein